MTECLFDNSKLRGKIIEMYGTIGNFSKAVDRNRSSISRMLNGKAPMDRGDIFLFRAALDISNDEIGDYFFKKKVVNS